MLSDQQKSLSSWKSGAEICPWLNRALTICFSPLSCTIVRITPKSRWHKHREKEAGMEMWRRSAEKTGRFKLRHVDMRVFSSVCVSIRHREQERVSAADRKGLWKVHSLHRELATCAEKLKNPSFFLTSALQTRCSTKIQRQDQTHAAELFVQFS